MHMTAKNTKPKLIDIEQLIASKKPKLLKWIPKIIINYLKRIIHQNDINSFLERNSHCTGIDFTAAIIAELNITYNVIGLENIPTDERYIFASNHPLGGLDGVIMMDAISKRFPKIKFPVNDLLMNLDNLKPLFLPVNKHGSQSQANARLLEEAYKSDIQILMFPAGLVSRKIGKVITDLEWKKSFVKKAIEHQRAIAPVHINGQNSKFFYNLALWRKRLGLKVNIEMLYLADELYKQRDAKITICFGKPISYDDLKISNNHFATANSIREMVYEMGKGVK